jgi:dTDP-4-dehydrorhamnose 3,5-epimerase
MDPRPAAAAPAQGGSFVIPGTIVRPLKKLVDERGYLIELMRLDWPDVYKAVPMSYVSLSYPGVIRAWHAHPRTRQRDTFVVPVGNIKAVVYDEATQEVNEHILGEDNPVLLSFDGAKWHGFKCIGTKPCLLINYPDKMYDYANPDEARRPFNDPKIPYDWDIVMK